MDGGLAPRLFERYLDCDNPLEQPAIVLVDEIDLHLHPKWQRTIIDHLTHLFKQTQFIVTAHSPLIVQSAPEDANIVLLIRQGDQVIIHNNEEAIKGWRIDQVLTSDLFDLPSAIPAEYDNYLKIQEKYYINHKFQFPFNHHLFIKVSILSQFSGTPCF